MPLLHLESLPARTTKGELLEFVCRVGGVDGKKIGRIDLRGTAAIVEVPAELAVRLVKALDGAAMRDRHVRAWSSGGEPLSGDEHFSRLSRLLDLESRAEAQQAQEKARRRDGDPEKGGHCLIDLVITEEHSGLGCRYIVGLMKRNRTLALPWNRLEAGAPVLLSEQGAAPGVGQRGVVCERQERLLRVAFDEPPEEPSATGVYRLDLSTNEISARRQRSALDRARASQKERLAELRQVLLGEVPPAFAEESEHEPLDESLNESQQEAVRFALTAQDFAVIHGPPGTGKTTTVVEVIRQAVRRGDKVLASAPSNMAVDNMLEKLLAQGERAIRLGHPARVMPELRAHTLDVLVEDQDDARLARKYMKEAFALFRKASKWTRAKPEPGARRDQRQEARALIADARKLEDQAVESVLNSATVICATLTGLDGDILGKRRFDLAVIDEACQSTEPACWIPLQRCGRLILAGDHCQLPPTVLSREASDQGYNISLLERLAERHGADVTRLLKVQYRMHEAIMGFSSLEFYDAELEADPLVAGHRLCDLPGVKACDLTEAPIHFIDTAGASYDEEPEPDGDSRRNPDEARVVAGKVRALLDAGVPATDVAVIAPYSAQVRLLRDLLAVPGLEIDSVDGFQGREKEAVVVSLVRSNRDGEIGFLADVRRTNVALTRARRKLIVVGDSATLSVDPFYQRMFTYFDTVGAYHTVWEEME